MEEETLQERQENELEALRAIFTDQFINLNERSPEWKPLNVILTVLPQRENSGPLEAHVQLDLHVIASDEYPNKVPKIIIEKSKGLSDKQVGDMQTKLDELAVALVGEVMVYDLVSYVQTVLTECNKPTFQSCYEEMVSGQKERKEKEVEMQKTEQDMNRQLIQLEVKGIKKERQRIIRTRKSSEISPENESNNPLQSENKKKNQLESPAKEYVNANGDLKFKFNDILDGSNESFKSALSTFNPNSRLVREFEILNFIGKGAFGDVLRVRNKLDDCLYAIKRIQLNLKNKQINKKIMREVKLLSRLNHENVVRYYNSWLENFEDYEDVEVTQVDGINNGKTIGKKKMKHLAENNLNLSFPHPGRDPSFDDDENDDDDDDEDDDDEDDDNDWIEFVEQNVELVGSVNTNSTIYESNEKARDIYMNQCMYIQMEFCEKSTLRNAIDDNLYLDENRVWRLLKEVVEGLAYIHEQGIIHRDLKPVNIFIDYNDHVKIGDFGLATPNKTNAIMVDLSSIVPENENSLSEGAVNASHTGQVGTALYVAPELNTCASKVHYNQKVDIYSLGIIFFEMCYPPLPTQMERLKILTNLRKTSRDFPANFFDSKWCRQIKLIRKLLNHNAIERPSAVEILKNEYIPLAEFEDEKLYDTIRHTLCNPQSKMYKHLIAECFNQKVSVAEDITFNVSSHTKTVWQHAFVEKLADNARRICRLHGATYFSTLFLTPNNGLGTTDTAAVSFMTRSGHVMNAPYDLRLCFARYLAQNPHIMHMKRYTVDKVFRERRMLGIHPKESFECTFDIVSPHSGNVSIEAELLSVICEFLDSSSSILQKNYTIRLNHICLVTAILFHHHIVAKKHQIVCNFLNQIKFQTGYAITKMNTFKEKLDDISETNIMNLINAMNVEVPSNRISQHFANLTRKGSASCNPCKAALTQLENLIQLLTALKIKCPIVIAPNVMTNYRYYSGIMFQVVWEHKNKNQFERDVIAVGGRYDPLIVQYRNALNMTGETKQSAAGLTIHLDRLTNMLQTQCQHFSTVDVLVCSVGINNLVEEKLKLVKELWAAEIRSTVLDTEKSLEETQEYCGRMNVPFILYLKESEPGVTHLRSWTKDRFFEKKLTLPETVPYLRRMMKGNTINGGDEPRSNNHHYGRSERSASVGIGETHNISITFLIEEKLTASNKRRYENQASNCITNSLYKISPKSKIELLILNLSYEVIVALVGAIDVHSRNQDYSSSVTKRFPKFKKSLNRVLDFVEKLQAQESTSVVIFYSLEDNNYKILI